MELLSTLGPSSLNEKVLKKLELLGVSLFRINLSHTETKDLEKIIDHIRNLLRYQYVLILKEHKLEPD